MLKYRILNFFRPVLRPFKRALYFLLDEYFAHNQAMIEKVILSKYDNYMRFMYYEISDIRVVLRHVTAQHLESLPYRRAQTMESFDTQWRDLPEGRWMLSNPEFRAELPQRIERFTGRAPEWFRGKRVLDAGCGSGRFTWAFASMGAEVVSVDQSAGGLAETRRWLEKDNLQDRVTLVHHNLLEPLPIEGEFDLVWSFGVLHHTGDTYRGFKNIVPFVRPGGYLFLMLYGEPRWGYPADFYAISEYHRLHLMIRNLPVPEALTVIARERPGEDVHGWFDRVSPDINDLYQFAEIESWLLAEGFCDIHAVPDMTDHHVVCQRPERNN